MFITIQFPFVDLRPFLKDKPISVPALPRLGDPPRKSDFKRVISSRLFIRSFGNYRVRGYEPEFSDEQEVTPAGGNKEGNSGSPPWGVQDQEQWESIGSLWKEEYLYASTRRGLRFDGLERNRLAGGKLFNPRCRFRAMRFSPFQPEQLLWSPCVRIEIGVHYSARTPITGEELEQALGDFLRIKVRVPPAAGSDALIRQTGALAALIVQATTAHCEGKVHKGMLVPGDPLLTVHYFPDEISSLPESIVPVSDVLPNAVNVALLPMKTPDVAVWLFGMPSAPSRSATAISQRVATRNNTIAVMRFWSEQQAVLALRGAILDKAFPFEPRAISDYVKRATRFLSSESWHGTRLGILCRIINAYYSVLPKSMEELQDSLQDISKQVAKKLINVGGSKATIFVSYSHLDARFLHYLHEAFDTAEFDGSMVCFDDTYLEAGEQWERRIKSRLADASVAILLVSPNFMNSKYIQKREMPPIEDKYKRGWMDVIPVLVDEPTSDSGFLEPIQFLNRGTPLAAASEDEIRRIFRQDLVKAVWTAFDRRGSAEARRR